MNDIKRILTNWSNANSSTLHMRKVAILHRKGAILAGLIANLVKSVEHKNSIRITCNNAGIGTAENCRPGKRKDALTKPT